MSILREIVPGLKKVGARAGEDYHIIADRREAIRFALQNAVAGDTVLIAGKGHETYQIIGTQVLPFDDRAVARELLHEFATGRN
jgi:UDP-N-acetylmuramoyl-L-alanyl-D-glutamate--2,6-diaminopimelate ligase